MEGAISQSLLLIATSAEMNMSILALRCMNSALALGDFGFFCNTFVEAQAKRELRIAPRAW